MKPTPFPLECQGPYRIVSDAMEWVREIGSAEERKLFFMWLSFPEPHNPYQVPEPYFSLFPTVDLPPLQSDKSALENKNFSEGYDCLTC